MEDNYRGSSFLVCLLWALMGMPAPLMIWLSAYTGSKAWRLTKEGIKHAQDTGEKLTLEHAALTKEIHQEDEEERHRAEEEAKKQQQEADQLRRDVARARLRLYYDSHADVLAKSYPLSQFEKYCSDFLGNDKTPDFVEEQMRALHGMLQRFVERDDPAPKEREERSRQEAEAERHRIDREAARNALRTFWLDNPQLAEVCSLAMLEAFMGEQMHEGVSPAAAWSACAKRLEDLQKRLDDRLERARKEAHEQTSAEQDLQRQIDAIINDPNMPPEAMLDQIKELNKRRKRTRITPEDLLR